ncbi:MAG: aspartate carbamoyltransferase [Symploca sp. SIO1B1]|uniref:Aspartate carbamoyltransferase n=1 Tax=Moorena producens PAL-8-15-08-1 TaxID=1458985 RepID=A0A1D8TZK8_9CYAN|nr:aspartate carbamoyltransferase [Moorena producens]NEQ66844.1 aspartate carbamoyltransferase [Symploca sp. SIO2D2]NER22213.1 aspartate carbamoyltransferase [Symploca sp. SIO1C2]NER49003.1 aspartate carbamoyltransferase [Symploca sp. SIO1A3]NER94583.1 aspartate carbamoyltransferase [Symploca sp. SIO1B1]AOX03078.1 aspartate carbamoyltransferase [Moorena producens PAL-8-15-08-1]
MYSFLGRDILSLKGFNRGDYFRLFEVCAQLAPIAYNRRNTDLLKEKTLVTAFYQPSTRTRLAHEAAMIRLGGQVTGFSDVTMTRAGDFYRESIKDTVKMLECYGDIIVMRHFQQGAPHEAAKWASVPVINGGDGWGEHPTQALTDLYTVLKEKGRIDGLRWLLVGDMRMRSMHSLAYALTQFDCPTTFVAPPHQSLTTEFKTELSQLSLAFDEAEHVEQAITNADVILVEPVIQPDYTKSYDDRSSTSDTPELTPTNYKISHELLMTKAKSDAILLHSFPRMDEIPSDVDNTRWSRYWQQSFNGVVVRMGLLALVLGAME